MIRMKVTCRRRSVMTAALLVLLSLGFTSLAFTQHDQCVLSRLPKAENLQTTLAFVPFSLQTTPTRRQVFMAAAKEKSSSNKGVYSRPSAAIERGSGFFIPGLEGPRVRLVFGIVVLVLTVLNHVLLSSNLPTVAFPERLAVVYAVLLLLQAAIEFGKEEKGYVVSLETDSQQEESPLSSSSSFSQSWSSSSTMSDEEKERVQWAAASYIALTPATHMLLLDRNDGVVYRLGTTPPSTKDSANDELEGIQAAFAALDKANSGRVSLPPTHPTVTALNADEEHGRCVVLQRIDDGVKCWMITSNQLLAAFTKDDLKWLGQLAKHVE